MSALELHNSQATIPPVLDRFRLVDRRPARNVHRRRRAAHPIRTAFLCTALPALLLVAYVALWTAAVHGGYQKQQIARDIQRIKTENQSLQAQAQRLQSSARILQRATLFGMQPPQQIESVPIPATTTGRKG